jgi:hypothetical protein
MTKWIQLSHGADPAGEWKFCLRCHLVTLDLRGQNKWTKKNVF